MQGEICVLIVDGADNAQTDAIVFGRFWGNGDDGFLSTCQIDDRDDDDAESTVVDTV